MPSASLDGPQTDLFGRVVVLANPSRPLAPTLAAPIPAIFGLRGISSSASAALQSSLVSRLKARLPTAGSTVFAMTWSEKVTPSGRSVCLLQVSTPRTADNASGSWQKGWPTPDAALMNDGADPVKHQERRDRLAAKWNNGNGAGLPLGQAVYLTAWPTQTAVDSFSANATMKRNLEGRQTGHQHPGTTLTDAARFSSWPTPKAEDSESTGAHRGTPDTLTSATRLSSWSTPSSRDWKDSPGMAETGVNPDGSVRHRIDQLPRQAHGTTLSGSPAATTKPGQLNPAFSRWLMGYPPAWDACAATATPSSRRSRRK